MNILMKRVADGLHFWRTIVNAATPDACEARYWAIKGTFSDVYSYSIGNMS